MRNKIHFHTEGEIRFKQPKKGLLRRTIEVLAASEKKTIGDLNIIFCSDDHLLGINNSFLKHNYYTDVITFDYSEAKKISGDIFISIDRIRENAKSFSQHFEIELNRVVLHGILHLCGHGDKTDEEIKKMRKKETKYLHVFQNLQNNVPRETLKKTIEKQ